MCRLEAAHVVGAVPAHERDAARILQGHQHQLLLLRGHARKHLQQGGEGPAEGDKEDIETQCHSRG